MGKKKLFSNKQKNVKSKTKARFDDDGALLHCSMANSVRPQNQR